MLMGLLMAHLQGYFTPEVVRMYERIHELIGQVGEVLPRLELLWWSSFAYHFARAEFSQAEALAERLVEQGRRHGHRGLQVLGYRTWASLVSSRGRPREALECLERGLALADFTLEEQRMLARRYWIEPRTTALAFGAIVQVGLGRVAESRRWSQEALAMAARVGHPHTLAYTQLYTALARGFHGDAPEVLRRAEQAIALASERGFVLWRMWATILRGWALSELGRPQEGLGVMQPVLELCRREGLRVALPHCMTLLASVHLKLGQVQEALGALEHGLGVGARTGEHGMDAALHRLRGEGLRLLARDGEARSCFLRAIAIAREQGVPLFELGATVSLGRLLRDTGRPAVARRLLVRALVPFAGEPDCADSREARALLAELGATLAAPPPGAGRA